MIQPTSEERRRTLRYEAVIRAQKGMSQRAIARELGIDRRTVNQYLQEVAERRDEGESALARALPSTRAPRRSLLDTYDRHIQAILSGDEAITAVRLHEELQKKGFTGGYTIVRERLKRIRESEASGVEPFTVVQTAPGHQGQFDWSQYTLPGCGLQVQLWSATLSWSRARSFASTTDQKQSTILRLLAWSFERWGGVPPVAVTDTMPGVVDRWEANRPILNARFVDFAAHYRFAVDVSPRRCPRYKGKVERPFDYLEKNLLGGRKFRDHDHFKETLAWWEEHRAMQRPHPKSGRPLCEMLVEERPLLRPLPAHPYDTRDVMICVVTATGHVHYNTNQYPVPGNHVGELVYVIVGADSVDIHDRKATLLAQYERLADGAHIQLEHPSARHRGRYDVDALAERLGEWGDVAQEYARRFRGVHRQVGPSFVWILQLQMRWSVDDILASMSHAMEYGALEAPALERILEVRATPRTLEDQLADSSRQRIKEMMTDHSFSQRPLTSYDDLRHGDRPSHDSKEETG